MKKSTVFLTLLALLLATLPLTVFAAHGHHSAAAPQSYTYTLCIVESCHTTGYHKHNGVTYTGHYLSDGHDYHQLCSVQNCTQTGSHTHDGITVCLPHNNTDGHSYHTSAHRSGGHH